MRVTARTLYQTADEVNPLSSAPPIDHRPHTVKFSKNWSTRFHLPFALGLSLDKYYEVATSRGLSDTTFGVADLEIAADVPLKFVPARLGRWTLTSGFHMLWLRDNNTLIAGPPTSGALNALNVTGGKDFEMWGVVGVKMEY